MENYKKIAKSIRMHHLMLAIVYGVIASALLFAVMIVTKNYGMWLIGLGVTACILVVFCLAGLLSAGAACAKIHRRIRSCDGTVAMESEDFTSCAKELSFGSQWLVYHKENTYLFWTRKNIHQIKVVSEKKNSFVLAVYSTLHPEGEALKCTGNRESLESLNTWLHAEM